jgi:hypothetical protein
MPGFAMRTGPFRLWHLLGNFEGIHCVYYFESYWIFHCLRTDIIATDLMFIGTVTAAIINTLVVVHTVVITYKAVVDPNAAFMVAAVADSTNGIVAHQRGWDSFPLLREVQHNPTA